MIFILTETFLNIWLSTTVFIVVLRSQDRSRLKTISWYTN